jgi:hypothetical protein
MVGSGLLLAPAAPDDTDVVEEDDDGEVLLW